MIPIFSRIASSSLVKSSFIYVFCDGINKAIPFLLLPFITHYLTPSDYGIITNFNVFVQILAVFCYLSTAGALPVMFHKLEKKEIKLYVSNMILINTYATFICVLICLSLFTFIHKVLDLSFLFQFYGIVVVWFAGITNVNMLLWRCEEKPLKFGIYQISQTALNAFSTILFVIILLLGWQGRVYSMILATVVFGLFSFWLLYKRGYLGFKISKEYQRTTLFFALPLVPHALSFWFKSGADKILLTNMSGLTENGLYSVAMTWGAVVSLFLMSFNNAYAPFLYKKLALFDKDRENTKIEQHKIVRIIGAAIVFTFIFVSVSYFLSYLMIKLIYASSYHDSIKYLPYVMVAQFFNGCYLMFVCFIHYMLKTKILGMITFSISILQVLLSYLLILYYGPVGVAVASVIGGVLIFLAVAYYAMKVYPLPWFYFKES